MWSRAMSISKPQQKVPDTARASPEAAAPRKPLTPAAERALAEAAARRLVREKQESAQPGEIGGRAGPDPVRYGDWEVKGIASDF